jgi:hypothetical protein
MQNCKSDKFGVNTVNCKLIRAVQELRKSTNRKLIRLNTDWTHHVVVNGIEYLRKRPTLQNKNKKEYYIINQYINLFYGFKGV